MTAPLSLGDANVAGALKNIYEGFRINAFPKLTVLLSQLKKARSGGPERMRWGGTGVYWDVVLTRPVGMTASPTGYLPPHAQATEKQASVDCKRCYITREVDGLALRATQASNAAYIPFAKKVMVEAVDTAALGQQEMLHGDGRAVKAIVSSVTSTTIVVVNSPYGVAGAGRGSLLLDTDMYVAVQTTGGTVRGRAKIVSVVPVAGTDNATVTFDAAIAGMAATDVVVAATTSDTSYGNFTNGLINLTNRGGAYNALHGIDGAVFSRWDATRMVAGTDTDSIETPGELDLHDLGLRIAGKSGKNARQQPGEFLVMTTPGLERKLAETLLGQRRFESSMDLKGGFKAISVNGLALVADYWCPAGTVYMIHTPSLAWVDLQDWVKLSYGDSTEWSRIDGRDAYRMAMGAYWNLCALQRNSHGSITGFTDTKRYDH